jgi:hypothetical protein
MPSVRDLLGEPDDDASKPPPTVRSLLDDPEDLRSPDVGSTSLNRDTLIASGAKYANAVYRARLDEGASEEEAQKAAHDAQERTMVVGDRADSDEVADALEPPTSVTDRVLGQRLIPEPVKEPTPAERDETRRETEREMRRATTADALSATWKGEGDAPGPTKVTTDEMKPWLQRAKDTAEAVAINGLSGGVLPLVNAGRRLAGYDPIGPQLPTIIDVVETPKEVLDDKDVRTFLGKRIDERDPNEPGFREDPEGYVGRRLDETPVGPLARATVGAVAASPIPDLVAAWAKYHPVEKDAGTIATFWDDLRGYDAFDAANDHYETGDRSKVDALSYRDLPATLRGEQPDVDAFVRAAREGNEKLRPLLTITDRDPVYVAEQIKRLPISTLREVQPDLVPTANELDAAAHRRAAAKPWRGTDEGNAALHMLGAGLLTHVGNAEDLIVVPSRMQEAMRLAGATWAAAQEADVPLAQHGFASNYLPEKVRQLRVPTARGLEQMATSGAYDDWLGVMGLGGSKEYAALDDPESTWLSRTLADTIHPDYASRWLLDPYLRAGGDPGGTSARALQTADLVGQFVVPADELVLAPAMKGLAAGNRMRAASLVAKEMGMSSREARQAMLRAAAPVLFGASDGIESTTTALRNAAVDGIRNGTLDPAKIGKHAKAQLVGLFRESGVQAPEEFTADLLDTLADRHARILDTAKQIEAVGGPETQKLRASTAYMDRRRDLDALVRAGNLTPQGRDLVLRYLEVSALNAADRGAVSSAEEYLARHRWEPGTEGEALPEGTLLSGDNPIRVVREVPKDEVLSHWESLYRAGKHDGAAPPAGLHMGEPDEWVEVEIPHDLYNADWNVEDGVELPAHKVERAQSYANQGGDLPPGMASFKGKRSSRAFVSDGNHRAYAAQLRGEPSARFYMPKADYERFAAAHPDRLLSENGGKVAGSIERSDDYARGRAYYAARRNELYTQGNDPVRTGGIIRGELPRQTAKMTPFERGVYDAMHGRGAPAPRPPRVGATVAPVAATEAPAVVAKRAAVKAAEDAWSREVQAVVAAGGDPWAWDAPTKHPSLDQARQAVDAAKRDLRAAQRDAGTLLSSEGDTLHGAISPAPPSTVRAPNPAHPEWVAEGKAAAQRVRDLEAAETPEHAAWRARQEERANLETQRDTLNRNPQPTDKDWQRELDDIEDRLSSLPDDPEPTSEHPDLPAARADLDRLRASPPPRTITKPSEVAEWILRLFRTGDVTTAFHEGTHLLDLMLGEEWTKQAAKALGFADEEIGRAFAGDRDAMVEIREKIAEAGTRALRGTLRPGSRLGNLMADMTDALTDLWRRVRRLPAVTTPEFRALWDATLRPNDATLPLAVRLVDERAPAQFSKSVSVPGVRAEEVAQGRVRSQGTAANALRVDREGGETRHILGLKEGQGSADPVELLASALAHIGTEHLRKHWGFGDLTTLTSRVAVPVERAKRVKREVADYRAAMLGKAPIKPTVVNGAEVFNLTRDQQVGMRRMLADVADSPLSTTMPERLLDRAADLSTMTVDEWNAVVAHQLEARAGAGAFRERAAERAATSGALRLIGKVSDLADRSSFAKAALDRIKDAFVVGGPALEYLGPAQREMWDAFTREIGESGVRVKNAVLRTMRDDRSLDAVGALRAVSAGVAPESVPVASLGYLRNVEHLAESADIGTLTGAADDVHRLFASSPIGSASQMRDEVASLSALDAVGRRMKDDGMDFAAALSDAGLTADQANDAMSIVQEGIRRRSAAVENAGRDILVAFAGSPDKAVLSGVQHRRTMLDQLQRVYANWYNGQWDEILAETTRAGQAAAGPKFDQGSAALSTLVRLEARRTMSSLADRMARLGIVGEVSDVAKGGLRFDRPYTLGGLEGGKEAYLRDVAGYIEAITGWRDTSTLVNAVTDAAGNVVEEARFVPAEGMRTASGTVNEAAYADAQRILSQWGFKTGKGTAWTPLDLGNGSKVLVPDLLREPLEEVINRAAPAGIAFGADKPKLGEITPGAATAGRQYAAPAAIDAAVKALWGMGAYSFGMLKTGLTTGIGPLIRPAFFVGNFLGGAFQLYQGVGSVDALRIMARPLMPTAEGATVRRVIARMWKDGMGSFGRDVLSPAERGFFDTAGRWHSDQSIAQGATRAGLNSSLAKTELANAIIQDIKNQEPTLWNRLRNDPRIMATVGGAVGAVAGGPGGAVAGAAIGATLTRRWQELLTEASTGLDNYYRVATYVDGLKRGVGEAEAANLARRVAFDYNQATDFERNIMRKAVMFYSYQRQNQDLFWHTLLTHPSRVLAQLRTLRGMQQENLGDDSELFLPEWLDGRMIAAFREPFQQGHIANAMRGEATILPKLPIGDAIGLWQSVLGIVTERDPKAARDLASRTNPWVQAVFVLATNTDPHTGSPLEGYKTIPNWLIEMDHNLTGGMLVRDCFQATRAQYRDASQEGYPGAPQWVVGDSGSAAFAWWMFRNTLPAGMETDIITAMQRADLGDSLVGDHGFVQAAVDASRDVAPSLGNTVTATEEDTETARPGLMEGEELGGWLGFRPQQIPTRTDALNDLQRRRESEITTHMQRVRKEGEHAYR